MRHQFISSLIDTKYRSISEIGDQLGLGSPEMPALSDLFDADKSTSDGDADTGKIASAGVVRLNFTAPQGFNIYDPRSNKDRLSNDM